MRMSFQNKVSITYATSMKVEITGALFIMTIQYEYTEYTILKLNAKRALVIIRNVH